jgi:hypothetical protein
MSSLFFRTSWLVFLLLEFIIPSIHPSLGSDDYANDATTKIICKKKTEKIDDFLHNFLGSPSIHPSIHIIKAIAPAG